MGANAQGLGRPGGLSTKTHAAGDALGNPVRLIGSPGQRTDIAFAHELVEASLPASPSPTKATTPITCATGSPKAVATLPFRPSGTGHSNVPGDAERLQGAQHHRGLLQQAEHFRCLATRYDVSPRQLHGLRQNRRYRYLAQIVKLSLRPRAFQLGPNRSDLRIGEILIQPAGWAEASRR